MAARKLTATVYVSDEKGHVHRFGPEDTLPAWARKAITNPKAFGQDPEEDDREPDARVLPVNPPATKSEAKADAKSEAKADAKGSDPQD